jgi:chromosomal replication initiator protein
VETDSSQSPQSPMQSSQSGIVIWRQAIGLTRARCPSVFEQWFSSVQFDQLDAGVLDLTARDEFVRDWVKDHFLPELVAQLERLLGENGLRVRWRISSQLDRPVCRKEPGDEVDRDTVRRPTPRPAFRTDRPPSVRPVSVLAGTLSPKYTFGNFVVGPSNELAYAAAFASAGGGGRRYNPLFIAGATGLGKTHLVHAIAHKVLAEAPASRVVYVSAEHFTNDFIEALQHHKMDEFRARYRNECDLLLVDDIQFLAGREQTQEEFFHTFNVLRDADRPIVVTSDKYPQQLQRMPERLVSRFTSGLVADIQVPQLETRVAILRKKADLEGISLDDDVAVFLAELIHSNVRELEGALIRLAAKSSLTGRPVDLDFARGELLMVARRQDHVSVEDIQRAVCGHFRLSNADLLSKDRHKSVAFARQVAIYLCRQRLKCSYPELGRAFGNRDHTTAMNAVRRVESLRQTNPEVKAHLEAIEERLAATNDD